MIRDWVHGDTGTSLVVTVTKLDGTHPDLTGATAITLTGREVGGIRTVSATNGSVYGDADNGQVKFDGVCALFDPGASGAVTFEFRVAWTISAVVYESMSSFLRRFVSFP